MAMEEVLAWEHLHDPEVGGQLNAEGFLDLAMRAGYPEETAQKGASERAWQRLRKDLPP